MMFITCFLVSFFSKLSSGGLYEVFSSFLKSTLVINAPIIKTKSTAAKIPKKISALSEFDKNANIEIATPITEKKRHTGCSAGKLLIIYCVH